MKVTVEQNGTLITKSIEIGAPLTGLSIHRAEIEPGDNEEGLGEYLQNVVLPKIASKKVASNGLTPEQDLMHALNQIECYAKDNHLEAEQVRNMFRVGIVAIRILSALPGQTSTALSSAETDEITDAEIDRHLDILAQGLARKRPDADRIREMINRR